VCGYCGNASPEAFKGRAEANLGRAEMDFAGTEVTLPEIAYNF